MDNETRQRSSSVSYISGCLSKQLIPPHPSFSLKTLRYVNDRWPLGSEEELRTKQIGELNELFQVQRDAGDGTLGVVTMDARTLLFTSHDAEQM